MKRLALLLVLLVAPALARAQETEPPDGTRIASVQLSGFDRSRLSPGLQDGLNKLTGTPLNRTQLHDLAARIEGEQPRYVAAVRVVATPTGEARVVFAIARLRDEGQQANINTKYVVDEVLVRGVPDAAVPAEIWSELRAMKGKPFDSDEAERLGARLRAAFPEYDLQRRTVRGDEQGQINVVYTLTRSEWARWLHFEPLPLSALYHSDQGWGAFLPLSISGKDVRFEPILAWDHGDDLVEEYSGFGIRVETRKLGTERLGLSFEWSTYGQDWRESTLAALALNPQIPGLYGNRSTVSPVLRFAITPRISIAGGVSIVELDPLSEDPLTEEPIPEVGPSRMANAFIGSVTFNQRWRQDAGARQHVAATFSMRFGSDSLESDLVYERYLGSAGYLYRWGRHGVFVSGMAGGISGDAPLFERFTLGDSRTLRGWDKWDIAPAGGDRVFHTSVEYRYSGLALFLDTGSVWDTGTERRFRVSTGVGFHPGPVFFTLGFPVNTDDLRAVFTMGIRFSSTGFDMGKW